MADDTQEDFTIDRTGDRPVRKDNRGMLHMLHDEIGKTLGIGQGTGAGKHVVGGKPTTVMEAVDDAVKGAPAPGSDY